MRNCVCVSVFAENIFLAKLICSSKSTRVSQYILFTLYIFQVSILSLILFGTKTTKQMCKKVFHNIIEIVSLVTTHIGTHLLHTHTSLLFNFTIDTILVEAYENSLIFAAPKYYGIVKDLLAYIYTE